jgi:Peptidase A4 family
MPVLSHFTVPTGIPNIRAYPAPPSAFDAVRASNRDLLRFGYPPRPNRRHPPAAFDVWHEIVATPLKRVIPRLVPSTLFHRPVSGVIQVQSSGASGTATSDNWSGIVIEDNNNPFASVGATISVQYTVPRVSCRQVGLPAMLIGPVRYLLSSQWIGVDGWGTSTSNVLQCGTASTITCPSKQETLFWIEWWPAAQVTVGLGVSPGDRVSLSLTVLGPTSGSCALSNFTTGQSSSLAIGPPPGVRLTGNCIEWVVEKTAFGGAIPEYLPNYGSLGMSQCAAHSGQTYLPGSNPTGIAWNVSMQTNGTPCSVCAVPSADQISFSFVPR